MSKWIDKYMKLLAKHEGTRGAEAIEGGGYTRGYGLTDLAQSFMQTKGANASEMSDEELAREYVLWNIEQLKNKFDNYDDWPASVQMATVDLAYNGGNVLAYKGFSNNLRQGKYQEAMAETLDIVGANDPKTGKRGALRGLGNRRFDFYNMVADELDFPKIDKLDVVQQGTGSLFSYTTADGGSINKAVSAPIHSASGAYDTVKKKTESVVTEGPLTKDLSNQELVDLANQKIAEAKNVTAEPIQTITATKRTPEPEDFEVGEEGGLGTEPTAIRPSKPVQPVTLPEFESDNMYVQKMASVPEPEPLNLPQGETLNQRLQQAIEQDYESNGEFAQFIKRDAEGLAAPFYFTDDISDIARAAFRQVSPVKAAIDWYNDKLFMIDDDPDYDFIKDEQLKDHQNSLWRFYDSKSAEETAVRLKRLKQEQEDQSILSGSSGAEVTFGMALTAPSTVLPLTTLRGMKAKRAIDRALSGAAFTGGAVAIEQSILSANRELRAPADTLKAIAISAALGGSVTAAFGRGIAKGKITRQQQRNRKRRQKEPTYKAAGANVNPEILRRQAYETIEQDALKETGVGLEKLGWNPTIRLLQSPNPIVRGVVAELVDLGGMMQKKVDDEIAMSTSVESNFAATYTGRLLESIRALDEQYLAYRGVVAKDGDIARSFQIMGIQAKDKFKRTLNSLTEYEFRVRVAKAMRRGDEDGVIDAATPYVNQAARKGRDQFNFIKTRADEVRLFEDQAVRALRAARAADAPPARIAELEARVARIRQEGVFLNSAQSYVPRIYRVDRIMAEEARFRNIIMQYGSTRLGLAGQELDAYVDDIFDSVTKQKPYAAIDDADDLEDVVTAASTRSRELDIEDTLIEDFLENDIEVLLRHHTTRMGMDIELHKAFGSVDMKNVIDQVVAEYGNLMSSANVAKRAELQQRMLADLRDIRGLRDRVRGTYGASKDPHAVSSRFVRAMKSFNVIVGMGGATISSIPDIARTAMVEGFRNTYDKGLAKAFSQQATQLRKLSKKELRSAGVAADAILGLRSSAMADLGDIFGNRFGIERMMNQSTGVMFMMNGLNIWNQTLKEFAGTVTMLRMTEDIMKPWASLSKTQKEKFLKVGIDGNMHTRMQSLIRTHGEQVDGEWMPNTSLWGDASARLAFRQALNKSVDRVIITPGAGDRALWTSTELGSLMTQFKSYGQGATVRMLTSGLQERDGAFWQGAFLLVGLAAMVNEIKRLQYGIDREETFDEKLINAIDRSGILGYFMDVNNAIEKVSNREVGLRPMITDQKPYPMPMGAKAGAIAGPTAGNITNLGGIIGDLIGFRADADTLKSVQFLTPYSNLPYTQPLSNMMFDK
ncbi:MAG: hypothetical protein CMF51_02365 [Legionellales bacterium]|nr:hypothetical protein [Legionellales bacterium]